MSIDIATMRENGKDMKGDVTHIKDDLDIVLQDIRFKVLVTKIFLLTLVIFFLLVQFPTKENYNQFIQL